MHPTCLQAVALSHTHTQSACWITQYDTATEDQALRKSTQVQKQRPVSAACSRPTPRMFNLIWTEGLSVPFPDVDPIRVHSCSSTLPYRQMGDMTLVTWDDFR